MCGINGFNFKDERLIKEMNRSLNHRGPDGSSHHLEDGLSLGHTRLSIIDLSSAATQPMQYEHDGRNLFLVFNGEIYNYIELRNKLRQAGYQFRSSSDTEVIMAAYCEWGEMCVNHFNGMWSFCLYDKEKRILLCSRDRLGVKPFYYYWKDGVFIFSSELKSIVQYQSINIANVDNISEEAVQLYFSLGYIPAPATVYKNIFKLESGTNLCWDLGKSTISSKYRYYQIPEKQDNHSKAELLEKASLLLKDSVSLRMRSDVPVGAFLSGGLDSSTVVGEMCSFCDIKNLHTFSIGFEDRDIDESQYINIVKDYFTTHHHHHIYTENDFNATWSKYSELFDEPFGDYSSFPSYQVCKMARRNVTVSLSGDGGDEIFGGYPIYNIGYLVQRVSKLPRSMTKLLYKTALKTIGGTSAGRKVNEVLKLSLLEKTRFHASMFADARYKPKIYDEWTSDKMSEALDISKGDLAEALRIYDLLNNTLADNYLTKVDRTSMAHSIEVRSPFLDYRFIELSQEIPRSLKVGMWNNKILMRELIRDIVPSEILQRNKMGFTPPIKSWLYRSISEQQFLQYREYLKNINLELYDFYKGIFAFGTNDYMLNFYMIKLAIFGKWYDRWILHYNPAV